MGEGKSGVSSSVWARRVASFASDSPAACFRFTRHAATLERALTRDANPTRRSASSSCRRPARSRSATPPSAGGGRSGEALRRACANLPFRHAGPRCGIKYLFN